MKTPLRSSNQKCCFRERPLSSSNSVGEIEPLRAVVHINDLVRIRRNTTVWTFYVKLEEIHGFLGELKEHTVTWKFEGFSATYILREINFWQI